MPNDNLRMKPVSTKLEKIGGKYFLNIPNAIVELMGWSEGEYILVPFHELVKKDSHQQRERPIKYEEEVQVKLGDKPKKLTRKAIIDLLENPKPDLYIYRTAYIEYKGERFGSKAVCKKLLDLESEEFSTAEGEWYLRKLGFVPKRTYNR
jgi:hypothetical protein